MDLSNRDNLFAIKNDIGHQSLDQMSAVQPPYTDPQSGFPDTISDTAARSDRWQHTIPTVVWGRATHPVILEM